MLRAAQVCFFGDLALAVTAQTSLGSQIPGSGKESGGLVRQMAGRAYAGLDHSLALQVFFFRSGARQIVSGIGNGLFIRVTDQAKGRFFIFGDQQCRR